MCAILYKDVKVHYSLSKSHSHSSGPLQVKKGAHLVLEVYGPFIRLLVPCLHAATQVCNQLALLIKLG